MIHLKQSMGNIIKGKVEPECMISHYECNVLEKYLMKNFLRVHIEKVNLLSYSGDLKINLTTKIINGLGAIEFMDYMKQIVSTVLEVEKIGLFPEKIVWNPDWIFFHTQEAVLKFIYCPINGMACTYDVLLFMRDLSSRASLDVNLRNQMEAWFNKVARKGITEQCLRDLANIQENVEGSEKIRTTELFHDQKKVIGDEDDVEEIATNIDDDNVWEDHFEVDNEAQTSMDDENSWSFIQEAQEDADDEAPTGMEDDSIFTGNGGWDGTYSESNSEPFSQGGSAMREKAFLVRVSTGEKIAITKAEFRMGRSEQRTDYCIKNNTGVSNVHATVLYKNGEYYIKDNHSTNGTYVNGEKINADGSMIKLRSGSVIRLYNEEIIFEV